MNFSPVEAFDQNEFVRIFTRERVTKLRTRPYEAVLSKNNDIKMKKIKQNEQDVPIHDFQDKKNTPSRITSA